MKALAETLTSEVYSIALVPLVSVEESKSLTEACSAVLGGDVNEIFPVSSTTGSIVSKSSTPGKEAESLTSPTPVRLRGKIPLLVYLLKVHQSQQFQL